jgi:phage-related protein
MATVTSLMLRMTTNYNGDGMRQARRDIANLDSGMTGLSKSSSALVPGFKALVSSIIMLGPALIPIAGGLLGIGAAAGSAFVSAGGAVGIWALALKGAITQTVGQNSAVGQTAKALDNAQKQLNKATVGSKEYEKAQKAVTEATKAHEAALKGLPSVQENFARAYDDMKNSVEVFNDENAKFTLRPATTMLQAFTSALPHLTGVIKAVEPELQRVANLTKKWVEDGGLDRFLNFLIKNGVPALHGFIDAARSLFTALGQGMRDTAPLGQGFVDWLVKTMDAFSKWATGGGFQRFLEWLTQNKAQLLGIAKDLGTTMGNLGTALGNMSGLALTNVGVLLKILASFPPGMIQTMAYAWVAWNAALVIYNVVGLISAGVTTVMALATSSLGIALLGVMLTIGLVILAIIAVGVGIFFLVKYWDTVMNAIKNTALTVWGWLQTAWAFLWDNIKSIALKVWDFLTHGWGQLALFFMGPVGLFILVWKHWDEIWGGIKSTADTVWSWLKSTWSDVAGWFLEKWNAAIAPVVDSWNTIWPQLQLAAQNVWTVLKTAWSGLWTAVTFIWNEFWGVFGGTITSAWSGVTAVVSGIWDTFTASWAAVWTAVQGIFKVAWAVLSGLWSVAWSALVGVAQVAWAVFTGAWQVVWSIVTGIWNVFYAGFTATFSAAWKVLVAIVTGIWDIIKAAWTVLWSMVTAIFMTFLAIFTGNWSGAWTAIKASVMAIWNLIQVAWQALLNVITTLLNGFISVIKALWSAFWTAIQNTAMTFWNALKNLFQTSMTAIQTLWNTAWTAVRTVFQTITTAIQTTAAAVWAAMRTAMNTFLTAIQSAWNTMWTAIRTFFGTTIDALVTAAKGLWTTIQSVFSAGSTWLRTTFWNPVETLFTKTIPAAFKAGADALGKAWDTIKNLVRAPIQAVVNVVYNDGIVKLWNVVAGVFGAKTLSAFKLPSFRDGGPTGDGSQDGFLAKVHPGEHVWTREEVAGAGGHKAVARLRQAAMGGAKVRLYGKNDFDDGGGILGTGIGPKVGPDLVPDGIVSNAFSKLKDLALGAISGPFNAAVDGVAKLGKSAVRAAIPGSGTAMEQLGTGMVDKIADVVKAWVSAHDIAPDVGGGNTSAALAWAKTQVGKPYQWGGVGPAGYDCSGFMGAIQNVINGKPPNKRVWATGAFSGGTAPAGWSLKSKAPFMVGITNAGVGHTAGTLNGTNVESHGGAGVVVGKDARGYNDGMFQNWYGYGPSKDTGSTSGSAQATAKMMLKNYGWALDQWPSLQKLWQGESGWNYKATNPSSGAYGIPQALPASKMASAGSDWKTNASTQIKWGEGYIKSVYGTPASAYSKWLGRSPHWYWRGTQSAYPGMGVVGEHGPEIMRMRGGERITPLDLSGRNNAGSGGANVTMTVYAPGATHAVVDRLNTELPDKLRMALEQGTGRRP